MRLPIAATFLAGVLFASAGANAQNDPWGGAPVDPWSGQAPIDPWGGQTPSDPWGEAAPPEAPGETTVDPYALPPADDGSGAYQAPQGTELAPPATPPPPVPAQRIENRVAVFSGLDKITGRITSFDAYVDETVQFGSLQVTPRACFTAPPEATPKTDTFVEVDEITLERDIRRIFTGWMFADSPGLNAVEHPVYDVWLQDCRADSDVPASAS